MLWNEGRTRFVPLAALATAVESRNARLIIASWNVKNNKKTSPNEFLRKRENCIHTSCVSQQEMCTLRFCSDVQLLRPIKWSAA